MVWKKLGIIAATIAVLYTVTAQQPYYPTWYVPWGYIPAGQAAGNYTYPQSGYIYHGGGIVQ